jgi:hypothetical protein
MCRLSLAIIFQIAVLISVACGADLTCFKSQMEASGYYFIQFGVEQAAIAENCDNTYRLWNPSLFEIATNVMANSYESRPEVKQFVQGSEQLANRLGMPTSELFAIASQRTLQTLAHQVSKESCWNFAKQLKARLSAPDEIILWTNLSAEIERERGNICR